MTKPNPTIHDVADAAGVSIATVSYVLNGSGRYSAETAKKVQAAVKKLNYKANRNASSLKSKKSHTIGIVISTIVNDDLASTWTAMSGEILYRLTATAMSRGYSVVLVPSENLNSLSTIGVDALIVSDSRIEDPAIAAAHKLKIPVGTNERPDDSRVSVNINDGYWEMTQAALEHLKIKGAKKIGLLTEPIGSHPDQRIIDAYTQWCLANAQVPIITHGNFSKTNTSEYVRELISQGVDSIYSYYEEGPAILSAIRESGLRVPEDIMLIAVANSSDIENEKLGISSVLYNPPQHAEEFAQKLIDIVEKKEQGPVTLYSDWSLVPTKTTND